MKVTKRTSTYYEFDDGTRYPRVTTVLDASPRPFLERWKVNTERDYVINAAADLNDRLDKQLKRAPFIAALTAGLKEERAHQKKAREAANIGTEAHALIEWDLRHELIPAGIIGTKARKKLGPKPAISQPALIAYNSWQNWRASRRLEPIGVEMTVYSRDLEVAGTLDLLSQFFLGIGYDPQVGIHDWKTSGDIYPEQKMQVAIYRHCLIEMGHANTKAMGVIVKLSKVGEPEFEVAYVHPDECAELIEEFRHLRCVYDFFLHRKGERKEREQSELLPDVPAPPTEAERAAEASS